MKIYLDESDDNEKNAAKKYLDKTSDTYNSITKKLELNPDDAFHISAFKIFLRLIFLLVCLALSPFIIIGLFIALLIVA
jgi:hypothetical protein